MLTEPVEASPTDLGQPALATSQLALGGMHCSACATRIQKTLGKVPGGASASVNLATTRAFVSYDPALLGPAALLDHAVGRSGTRRD